jgi:hypothetical protein
MLSVASSSCCTISVSFLSVCWITCCCGGGVACVAACVNGGREHIAEVRSCSVLVCCLDFPYVCGVSCIISADSAIKAYWDVLFGGQGQCSM